MKTKLLASIAIAAAALAAVPASAAVEIDFNSPAGTLGTSQVYSNGGLSVTAYGFDYLLNPTQLYGKNAGGDENGVGVASDPTGNNEIWAGDPGGAVVLDVSNLLMNGVTAAQFFMGSTTGGESWNVYEWNGGTTFTKVLSGNTELTWTDLPDWGSTKAYAFTAGAAGQNVLLGGLSLTQAVPEPATWAMMLLGFGGIGMAMRRRRGVKLAQVA